MTSFYTHYWAGKSALNEKPGELFTHTAGSLFRSRGLVRGDRIYCITRRSGNIYLIGAMTLIQPPLTQKEAVQFLSYPPWDAPEHLIGDPSTASTFSLSRLISVDVLKSLQFISSSGKDKVKFISNDETDYQTLRGVRRLTTDSAGLLETLLEVKFESEVQNGLGLPERIPTLIQRIQRDSVVVSELKSIYDHLCQICGYTIDLPGGGRYSEGHHIRPLGDHHAGKDVLGNLLCVCPNCHAKLDNWCMKLDTSSIHLSEKHSLDLANVDYHNNFVDRKVFD